MGGGINRPDTPVPRQDAFDTLPDGLRPKTLAEPSGSALEILGRLVLFCPMEVAERLQGIPQAVRYDWAVRPGTLRPEYLEDWYGKIRLWHDWWDGT